MQQNQSGALFLKWVNISEVQRFFKNSSVQYGLGAYREFYVWSVRSAGLHSLLELGRNAHGG